MTTVAAMIPHSRPSIEEEDVCAATEVLRSRRLAQGSAVERFERSMAAFLGLAGGVAVNSGTSALEVALRALEIGPGDEVILPSYVCAAPWLAVRRVGATAKLVDIELETFNVDPDAVLPIVEDCAHTLGAMERGRAVGSVGVLTVCSFYATKLLCAGEGGMVLSRDETLLERARALREYDEAPSLNPAATNLKMTDLHAAIGLAQLERLPSFLARRVSIAQEYSTTLEGKAAPPVVPDGRSHVYYRFVVRVPEGRSRRNGLSDVMARFEERGIQCRKPVFRSIHRYLELEGFPASDEAERTALSIPLFPSLADAEVAQIVTALRAEWS
jgi:perosamine synthetase